MTDPTPEEPVDLWSIRQVADHLGGVQLRSASRTIGRWGIKAVTYERGPSGRPEARYDPDEIREAAAKRPGRGARTDLKRGSTCTR